jgi:hypothetical protein
MDNGAPIEDPVSLEEKKIRPPEQLWMHQKVAEFGDVRIGA